VVIGIVSTADDLHAVGVRRELDRLGADHTLIDTGLVPARAALSTHQIGDRWTGRWHPVDAGPDSALDLSTLHAMWWRRPQPFELPDTVRDPQDRGFAHGECAAMVAGLWSCLDAAWVNDPDRDEIASRKMWQLRVASELGFRVPRTCMTNDPDAARAFVAGEPGAVIFKPFSGSPQTWRETRVLGEAESGMLDQVRPAPVIFQELIPGGIDLRVTIVGTEIFPAEIRACESAYEFDFRIDTAGAPILRHELPTKIISRLRRLMARLGLSYGAVDLRLAPNGDYVFLEINPAGQWLFVEYATDQPISAALAQLLATVDRSRTTGSTGGRDTAHSARRSPATVG